MNTQTDLLLNLANNLSKENIIKFTDSLKEALSETQILDKAKSTLDLFYEMARDYANSYYDGIDEVSLPLIGLGILYFILPESLFEDILGKKTLFRSAFVFGTLYFILNRELKKYKLFLNENLVVEENNLGKIIYFKHRLNDEYED
ncbi:MAG: hypothetical protein SOZ40_01925 [Ezakiella sp.]|nr:hypothetical protein [Ezakiella sp.]